MTCYYPMLAHEDIHLGKRKLKIFAKTEKMEKRFAIEKFRNKNIYHLPCGKCIGCRLDKAREWAVRCVNEASLHDENSFITLTYNNENLPDNGSLYKRDLQLFFKRLRKNINQKVRYYACGEYGETGRPHYHICLFGYDFKDKEIIRFDPKARYRNKFKVGVDKTLYTSKHLEEIWQKKGFVAIGEVTVESAGYCARYVSKKVTGDSEKEHYKGRLPEFAVMSRRPGIGYDWFKKYHNDVYPKDFVVINGVKHKPSKYYDSLLEKMNNKMYEEIKEKRKKEMLKNTDTSKRLIGKDKYKRLQTKCLERNQL
jgi:hypothetical protein